MDHDYLLSQEIVQISDEVMIAAKCKTRKVVVRIGKQYFQFEDAISYTNHPPEFYGWKFDPNTIKEVYPKEKVVIIYE